MSIREFKTSGYLNLRLSLMLLLSYLFFAALADYFLYQSLIAQDRSLISARIQNYERILSHAGIDKLIEVIVQEQSDPEQWLIEVNTPSGLLFSNQREHSVATRLLVPIWPVVDTERKRWFVQQAQWPSQQLTIGLSSIQRQQQQAEYRWAIVLTLSPLYLISVLLLCGINRRTLRPIRDLVQTVDRIQSGQHLSERVIDRHENTELGLLVAQTNHFLANNERLIKGMKASLDNVAHDLRTPLARQRLRIEQLLLDPNIQAQSTLYETFADITEESQRIEQMLTTLMDISEAETGLLTLHKTEFKLATLFEQVVELYEFLAEDQAISLSWHCPETWVVQADINRLRQVLINLLDNAIKYSPAQTLVHLWADKTPAGLLIGIQDQGQGIAAQDLPFIFDRLYRADLSRNTKGLGLGLSLVKAVVEAHQGQIQVQNLTPCGCQFTLILPLGGTV